MAQFYSDLFTLKEVVLYAEAKIYSFFFLPLPLPSKILNKLNLLLWVNYLPLIFALLCIYSSELPTYVHT